MKEFFTRIFCAYANFIDDTAQRAREFEEKQRQYELPAEFVVATTNLKHAFDRYTMFWRNELQPLQEAIGRNDIYGAEARHERLKDALEDTMKAYRQADVTGTRHHVPDYIMRSMRHILDSDEIEGGPGILNAEMLRIEMLRGENKERRDRMKTETKNQAPVFAEGTCRESA